MKKVFVGGFKNLKALPPKAISLLNELADKGARFLVGDCAGTDTLVQAFLREREAKRVRIYTAADSPRNNLGAWKIRQVKHRRARFLIFGRCITIRNAGYRFLGVSTGALKLKGTENRHFVISAQQ